MVLLDWEKLGNHQSTNGTVLLDWEKQGNHQSTNGTTRLGKAG